VTERFARALQGIGLFLVVLAFFAVAAVWQARG